MLRSDLCEFSKAYIFVKGKITVAGANVNNGIHKEIVFKNNAPFRSCISKINNTFIDNAEDLDILMPLYNLLENCDSYLMTLGSLCNYGRDEVNNDANEKK